MTDRPLNPTPPGTRTTALARLGDLLMRRPVRWPMAGLGMLSLVGASVALSGRAILPAASQDELADDPAELVAEIPVDEVNPAAPFTFRGLDLHPDRLFARFFDGAFSVPTDSLDSELGHGGNDFRYRLDMYVKAYGQDDNFTIRILDDRTGETLEVHTLRDLKAEYERTGSANWGAIDFPARRNATTQLTQKWAARGIPREALVVRWGRANQTQEARDREAGFVEYEIQLARQLGLSLLATEIGTVETFNQDELVSPVGARSRYQMMPDIMRMFNVEQYTLPTTGGAAVQVREEQHPLLAMEPSMMLLRAYANAVGHELPGVSAYHTGPGNIFHLYQTYLRARAADFSPERHVSDAYMWGVTEGFPQVKAQSSFGNESRVYVLKAYGALRATEARQVEPARTVRAERVELREGASITLSELLAVLDPHLDRLDWPEQADGRSGYERFRALNPHMALPAEPLGGVPARGNVRLSATAAGKPVRFFLPLGAADLLARAGRDVIDPASVFNFDRDTFRVPESARTQADRDYAALVEDIGQFGFTARNKQRLDEIYGRLQALAQRDGSRYRQTQARIAQIHRSVWSTAAFRDLAGTAETLLTIVPQRREALAAATADAPTDG